MTSPCWTSQRSATWTALLPMRAADRGESRIARHPAERDRAIGGDGEAVAADRGEELSLVEIGMVFDLVGDDRLAGDRIASSSLAMVKLDTPMWRVRPARFASLSARMLSASGMAGLGQCMSRRSIRVDPEALQALLDRSLQRAVGDELRPHLGGDEDLVARHAGATACLRPPRPRCRSPARCRCDGSRRRSASATISRADARREARQVPQPIFGMRAPPSPQASGHP